MINSKFKIGPSQCREGDRRETGFNSQKQTQKKRQKYA